jgi:hypothetical protein
LHSFANSNPGTFACAIDVRVSLTHNISLAPLDPVRATAIDFFVQFQNPVLWKNYKREFSHEKLRGNSKENPCCSFFVIFASLFCFCNFKRQSFAFGFVSWQFLLRRNFLLRANFELLNIFFI